MQILLTNDDGIHSPGLKVLAQELQSLGHVMVVAPATEQSGISHALTFRSPLFVREICWDNGMKVWAVEGSPADCTRIGVLNLCEQRPDIVISGLNQGLNIGCNVVYSGTVAGAEEGAMLGIDSFAVSLEYDKMPPWDKASALVTQVIRQILEAKVNSDRAELININVPLSACCTKQTVEVCVVPVDQTPLVETYSLRQNPYGEPYYWISGRVIPGDPNHNTDRVMVKKGYVTVTPLEYNRTNRTAIEKLELAFVDKTAERSTDLLPDASDVIDELLKPDDDQNRVPQAFRDNMNNNVSSKPPKSNAHGKNGNSSHYSEGT